MIKPESYQSPAQSHYDVVIVGGAMYGTAVSWFLSDNGDFDGKVLVIERDPSYEFASTSHTNSCMRQQFSREINVRISRFAADFVKNFQHNLGDDPRVPPILLRSFGYLYLADTPSMANTLHQCQAIQAACGAATQTLTTDEIRRSYPYFNVDDIIAANHNRIDEGYFDGATMFDWWKRVARERGIEYLSNEVVAMSLDPSGHRVNSISLKTGDVVHCGKVVNASGPRAAATSAMAGIELPVEPRKRYTFMFDAQNPLDRDLPLTIDPSGVHMRSDGPSGTNSYLAGCPPDDDPAVEYDDFNEDHSLWQEKVWPVIAHRIPQFDAIRLTNSWVGHYAYNTFDQNAILGAHTTVENFLFVNGFSGHGLQQSPAMGRGTAELITYGEFRTLDLTPFNYSRIEQGQPFLEKAII